MPGVDELLRDAGIRYFFTDTHAVLFAEPRPKFGVYAPILCPNSGVAALARDTESSKQVWSAIEGYPGDYNYRDFYRDVGFDLDYEYLRPHLHQSGIRSHLGIKYYKITGRTDHKQPYDPKAALDKAAEHAGNFMFNREKQVEWLSGAMDGRPALIVAPYDAELFGHWWFEGPDWINFLLRKIHYDQQTVKTITMPEYLDRHRKIQVPSRRCRAGATRATARSGWKAPTTGFTATCTRTPIAWWSWRSSHPQPTAAAAPRPEPGRPRAAAGAVERLGLHHEDRHDGRLRPRADPRPRPQLQPPLRTDQTRRHRRPLAERDRTAA